MGCTCVTRRGAALAVLYVAVLCTALTTTVRAEEMDDMDHHESVSEHLMHEIEDDLKYAPEEDGVDEHPGDDLSHYDHTTEAPHNPEPHEEPVVHATKNTATAPEDVKKPETHRAPPKADPKQERKRRYHRNGGMNYKIERTLLSVLKRCKHEVDRLCRFSNLKLTSTTHGEIVRCLSLHSRQLAPPCRRAFTTLLHERHEPYRKGHSELYFHGLHGCEYERDAYCRTVPWGRGRVRKCLEKNIDQLSALCRKRVERQARRANRLRGLWKACPADLKKLCSHLNLRHRLKHTAAKCLGRNSKKISRPCVAYMKQHYPRWLYRPFRTELVNSCHEDSFREEMKQCRDLHARPTTLCLRRHQNYLSASCRKGVRSLDAVMLTCQKDIDEKCKVSRLHGVKPTIHCLEINQQRIDEPCRRSLARAGIMKSVKHHGSLHKAKERSWKTITLFVVMGMFIYVYYAIRRNSPTFISGVEKLQRAFFSNADSHKHV